MKTIKDSVHDHITVDGVARELLDTPAVQRLRRIRQLGTVHLVYPSANHTRFEHSLGVYHLACRALAELGIAGRSGAHLRAAAILHDIGHAPYSHNIESIIFRRTGSYHDDVLQLLEGGAIGSVLRAHDLEPDVIAGLIKGEGRYGQLISGELDVDRMDYLVRDAHHTGVPYGTIDHTRLLKELRFVDGQLVLAAGNVQTAESLLLARALMNPTVYNHHVARISKRMLRHAVRTLLDETAMDASTLRLMDDHDLHVQLRQCEATREMARRLDERCLYKRAIWAEYNRVPIWLRDAPDEELRSIEVAIADRLEIDRGLVIIDRPAEPTMRESTARVLVGEDIVRLGDRSPLVRTLRESQRHQWRLGVYCPREHREAVANAAASVLGLELTEGFVVERDIGRYSRLDEFEGRSSRDE